MVITPPSGRLKSPNVPFGLWVRIQAATTSDPFHSYFHRYKVRSLTPLTEAVMFSRPWAALAVLTSIATPLLSQNPPAPPPNPNPAPQSTDTTAARRPQRPLPRPRRPAPSNVTVTTGVSGGGGGITLDSTLLAGFRWRNIGPANMGGRVSSVTGIPSPSKTFFVAAAAGRDLEASQDRPTVPPGLWTYVCVSHCATA